jgi:hypothetical protein
MTTMPIAVRAVVAQAEREFRDLVVCRTEISWRITKLCRAMHELTAILNHERQDPLPLTIRGTRDEPLAFDNRPDEPEETNQIVEFNGSEVTLSDAQIKRACRIALMEAYGPASLHELYERIQRRGSCDFTGCSRPLVLLKRALAELESEGEAQVTCNGDLVSWRRTLGHDRVAFPHRAAPGPSAPAHLDWCRMAG